MMVAREFVRNKEVEPSSLIHDGQLVPVSSPSLIDCKTLGENVRNGMWLKYSSQIKPITLTDDDLGWKNIVLKAYDEIRLT